MSIEQERADFEAWYRQKYDSTLYCESRWEVWQARAALQSQDREDAVQAAINKLSAMTPRPPKAITYDKGWEIINVVQCELCPAIDHARRIEGEGE